MSKGKKSAAKSAPSQDVNWEQTLKEDKVNQVKISNRFISFYVLLQCVLTGSRKFDLVTVFRPITNTYFL